MVDSIFDFEGFTIDLATVAYVGSMSDNDTCLVIGTTGGGVRISARFGPDGSTDMKTLRVDQERLRGARLVFVAAWKEWQASSPSIN